MSAAPPLASETLEKPYFGADEDFDAYETLLPALGRSGLVAARFRRNRPDMGITLPNERSDVLMAVVNLEPQRGNDLWCEGVHTRRPAMPRGGTAVLDHRKVWTTRQDDPFDTVHIFIPVQDLVDFSREVGRTPIDQLRCPITGVQQDAMMHHLAMALIPALERPREVSSLFADHLYATIRLHLAVTYGDLRMRGERNYGGLSPSSEQRITEWLLDDLGADPRLSELAEACGMSTRHLSRAFLRTHGTTPHRWLLMKKAERAKLLIETTRRPLSEIAQLCGFADQSHLTRVFHRAFGRPPGAWRRVTAIDQPI